MKKEQELPTLYVFLAPRANSEQDGHFYWFLYRLIESIKSKNWEASILLPNQGIVNLIMPQVINSKIQIFAISHPTEWGNDVGKLRPSYFSKEIDRVISLSTNKREVYKRILLICNETSLSTLLGVWILLKKNISVAASLNLLDIGFWRKVMFGSNLQKLIWKVLLKRIERTQRLQLSTNSPQLLSSLQEIYSSIRIWPYYQLAKLNYIVQRESILEKDKKYAESAFTILIMPWSDYSDVVIEVLRKLLRAAEFKGTIKIHLKEKDSPRPYETFLRQSQAVNSRVILSQGVLEEREYMSLLTCANIVWFPYNSVYHAESGSGRAIDALVAGTPIVIDQKSNIFQNLHENLASYVFPVDNDEPAEVAKKFIEIIRTLAKQSLEIKERIKVKTRISDLAKQTFSADNMLNEVSDKLRKSFVGINPNSTSMNGLVSILLDTFHLAHFVMYQFKQRQKNRK